MCEVQMVVVGFSPSCLPGVSLKSQEFSGISLGTQTAFLLHQSLPGGSFRRHFAQRIWVSSNHTRKFLWFPQVSHLSFRHWQGLGLSYRNICLSQGC